MKGINNTRTVQDTMGKQLRKAREDKGFKRPVFVKHLNGNSKAPMESQAEMTVERLKQWEYGNNPIGLEWIPAICDVLDCDVGFLFGEYSEKKRQFADAHKTTGLSEESIEFLSLCNTWGLDGAINVIDLLIRDGQFKNKDGKRSYRSIIDLLNFFFSYSGGNGKMVVSANGRFYENSSTDGAISITSIRLDDSMIENAVLLEVQRALFSLKGSVTIG